jgi:hypothetical protein
VNWCWRLVGNRLFWQSVFYVLFVLVVVGVHDRTRADTNHRFVRSQQNTNHKIVQSQLNGCLRDNKLRRQVNYDTDLIHGFMVQLVKAAKANPSAVSQKRARDYQAFVNGLRQVPISDCQQVIYRP